MVDIHSHILSGLDDGPKTLEETLAMLRIAADTGTTDIVATPHANTSFVFQPELIERKLEEVRAAQPPLRVHTGCDFHLTFDNIQDALETPTKYTINHKQYLLVEFSDLVIFQNSGDVFRRMLERGIRPVITHPERNGLLRQRLETMAGWVREGCFIQVTAQSLLGRFGRPAQRFVEELVSRGLAHFVASDAHDLNDRTPRMDAAFRRFEKKFGAVLARRLFVENPRAVIEGNPVEPEMPPPEKKWWIFSRP